MRRLIVRRARPMSKASVVALTLPKPGAPVSTWADDGYECSFYRSPNGVGWVTVTGPGMGQPWHEVADTEGKARSLAKAAIPQLRLGKSPRNGVFKMLAKAKKRDRGVPYQEGGEWWVIDHGAKRRRPYKPGHTEAAPAPARGKRGRGRRVDPEHERLAALSWADFHDELKSRREASGKKGQELMEARRAAPRRADGDFDPEHPDEVAFQKWTTEHRELEALARVKHTGSAKHWNAKQVHRDAQEAQRHLQSHIESSNRNYHNWRTDPHPHGVAERESVARTQARADELAATSDALWFNDAERSGAVLGPQLAKTIGTDDFWVAHNDLEDMGRNAYHEAQQRILSLPKGRRKNPPPDRRLQTVEDGIRRAANHATGEDHADMEAAMSALRVAHVRRAGGLLRKSAPLHKSAPWTHHDHADVRDGVFKMLAKAKKRDRGVPYQEGGEWWVIDHGAKRRRPYKPGHTEAAPAPARGKRGRKKAEDVPAAMSQELAESDAAWTNHTGEHSDMEDVHEAHAEWFERERLAQAPAQHVRRIRAVYAAHRDAANAHGAVSRRSSTYTDRRHADMMTEYARNLEAWEARKRHENADARDDTGKPKSPEEHSTWNSEDYHNAADEHSRIARGLERMAHAEDEIHKRKGKKGEHPNARTLRAFAQRHHAAAERHRTAAEQVEGAENGRVPKDIQGAIDAAVNASDRAEPTSKKETGLLTGEGVTKAALDISRKWPENKWSPRLHKARRPLHKSAPWTHHDHAEVREHHRSTAKGLERMASAAERHGDHFHAEHIRGLADRHHDAADAHHAAAGVIETRAGFPAGYHRAPAPEVAKAHAASAAAEPRTPREHRYVGSLRKAVLAKARRAQEGAESKDGRKIKQNGKWVPNPNRAARKRAPEPAELDAKHLKPFVGDEHADPEGDTQVFGGSHRQQLLDAHNHHSKHQRRLADMIEDLEQRGRYQEARGLRHVYGAHEHARFSFHAAVKEHDRGNHTVAQKHARNGMRAAREVAEFGTPVMKGRRLLVKARRNEVSAIRKARKLAKAKRLAKAKKRPRGVPYQEGGKWWIIDEGAKRRRPYTPPGEAKAATPKPKRTRKPKADIGARMADAGAEPARGAAPMTTTAADIVARFKAAPTTEAGKRAVHAELERLDPPASVWKTVARGLKGGTYANKRKAKEAIDEWVTQFGGWEASAAAVKRAYASPAAAPGAAAAKPKATPPAVGAGSDRPAARPTPIEVPRQAGNDTDPKDMHARLLEATTAANRGDAAGLAKWLLAARLEGGEQRSGHPRYAERSGYLPWMAELIARLNDLGGTELRLEDDDARHARELRERIAARAARKAGG